MFRGLSKLGIALTIIFVISLVALLLELFYLIWRRHRRIPTTFHGNNNHLSQSSSSSSKEQLLYFFCLKTNLSKIEPNSAPTLNSNGTSPEAEMEVIDLLKLHSMKGPSRVLFTIKEEEREGVESADERSLCSSAEKEKKKEMKCSKRMSLQECFEGGEEPPLEVAVAIDEDDTTPFSTPCASPFMYFTPSASPTAELAIQAGTV